MQVSVGRIVHYVLKEGPSKGEHRPAIVVRVWDVEAGICQLQVFTDSDAGANYNDCLPPMMWETSVAHSEPDDLGATPEDTWHWPEHVE